MTPYNNISFETSQLFGIVFIFPHRAPHSSNFGGPLQQGGEP